MQGGHLASRPRPIKGQPWRGRWGSYSADKVVENGARSNRMEDNGARSNPQAQVELARLDELRGRLLEEAATKPAHPRQAPARVSPVLATVTRVLERADRPLRACEIHASAQELVGHDLRWTSVKAALAAGARGDSPRFERVRYGIYRSARYRECPHLHARRAGSSGPDQGLDQGRTTFGFFWRLRALSQLTPTAVRL